MFHEKFQMYINMEKDDEPLNIHHLASTIINFLLFSVIF